MVIKMYYNEENYELKHYGTPRHSGRYPYGSGERPFQASSITKKQEKLLEESKKKLDEFIKENGNKKISELKYINFTIPGLFSETYIMGPKKMWKKSRKNKVHFGPKDSTNFYIY